MLGGPYVARGPDVAQARVNSNNKSHIFGTFLSPRVGSPLVNLSINGDAMLSKNNLYYECKFVSTKALHSDRLVRV